MAQWLNEIERNLLARHLLPRGARLIVAVSGGLDSMVLLRILHQLSARWGWRLAVAHLNHCLRGRSSDADEALVRRVCASLKLPLEVARCDVAALAARRKLSIEMAAREARHAFLAETAGKSRATRVALAHHADDQVELFFLRLFRGSGGEGLAGMRWSNPSPADPGITLVRPLLDQPKALLAEYARSVGLRYREDASNATRDFLRNQIRLELLPLLRKEYQPGLTRTILRVMEILRAEAEFAAQTAMEWGSPAAKRRPFDSWPAAVQRRSLQQQLAGAAVAPEFDLIEALRLHPDTPVTVAGGRVVMCDQNGHVVVRDAPERPRFRPGTLSLDISAPEGTAFFDRVRVSWSRVAGRGLGQLRPREGVEIFDADRVGPRIILRHWQPGDRFQPTGMSSTVKLQDLFTNEKVLRKRRHELILAVTVQNEVFWVEGLRISERFKLAKSTRRRLIWRFERP